MLTVTEKAQEKIREVLANHDGNRRMIRVYLRGYG